MLKFVVPILAFAIVACSPASPTAQSTTTTTSTDMSAMPMSGSSAPQAGLIGSIGTVTQVDAAAGTITINHGAIAAVSWPAMTMQFHADRPAILQGLAVGDHVAFQLKSASEPQIVTMVQKQ